MAAFAVGGPVTAEPPTTPKNSREESEVDANDDPSIRGETFQHHWHQLRSIATTQTVPNHDDLTAVLNLLNQMTTLLQLELEAHHSTSHLALLGKRTQLK